MDGQDVYPFIINIKLFKFIKQNSRLTCIFIE
jgi:hypothetical protein